MSKIKSKIEKESPSCKLNREQLFNQQFVRSIAAHKCLYDNQCLEYRQRDLYNAAWEDVSKKCGESVAACRRRWRNLKTSTCRYIKQLQNASDNDTEHREYYLYADMKFVVPFLKSKQEHDESDESFQIDTPKRGSATKRLKVERGGSNKKRIKAEKKDDNKYQEYELVTGEEGDYILQRPSSAGSCQDEGLIEIEEREPEIDERVIIDSNGEGTRHIVQIQNDKDEQNPTTFTLAEVSHAPAPQTTQELTTDELFLKSLLPDISTMTKDQKRKFKIRVLTLIDEILS